MSTRIKVIGAMAAMILGVSSASLAETISDPVGAFGVMDDGEGHSRILFSLPDVDDASQDGNLVVGRATLTITVLGVPEDRSLALRIYPVTSPWMPGDVDWWTGWESPGGDIDSELYSRAQLDLSMGSSSVVFDMTMLVKEVVEDGQAFDGFLVTLDPEIGIGIPSLDVDRFQGLSFSTLDMDALTIGSLPPAIADEIRSPARLSRVAPDSRNK
jgi:hypothetical protein